MSKSKGKFLHDIDQFYAKDKKAELVNIYFIVCNQHKSKDYLNRVKIGYAKDVRARLAALQTGNPVELKVWHSFPVEIYRARRLEAELHKKFRWSRTHGEWFQKHKAIREWINEHKKIIQREEERPAVVLRKQTADETDRIDREYGDIIGKTLGFCFD